MWTPGREFPGDVNAVRDADPPVSCDPPTLEVRAERTTERNTEIIPTGWRRGVVLPIWKGKCDHQRCNNYRGVTLLSVPGKVLARILLDRVRQKLLTHQRHEQSGFTPKKSTVDRILVLRVLMSVGVTSAVGSLCGFPQGV